MAISHNIEISMHFLKTF